MINGTTNETNGAAANQAETQSFVDVLIGQLGPQSRSVGLPAPAPGEVLVYEGRDGAFHIQLSDYDGADVHSIAGDTARRLYESLGTALERAGAFDYNEYFER